MTSTEDRTSFCSKIVVESDSDDVHSPVSTADFDRVSVLACELLSP